jgi:hypothetical protein
MGAPSFALLAKGGMNPLPGFMNSGWVQWYPTLRKERVGWATRTLAAVIAISHPSQEASYVWIFTSWFGVVVRVCGERQ